MKVPQFIPASGFSQSVLFSFDEIAYSYVNGEILSVTNNLRKNMNPLWNTWVYQGFQSSE